KKCGEVIILSAEPEEQAALSPQYDMHAGSPFSLGQQSSVPEEEPTKVFDYSQMEGGAEYTGGEYGTEPEWHIAVDGEQMGPYSVEQMQEMLAAGQIDEETYLWKDGFGDWLPLRDIPEFQQAGRQAMAAAASYPPRQSADPYAQQQSADPYASQYAADPYAQQQTSNPYAQQTAGDYGGQQAQAPSSLFSEAFSSPGAGAGTHAPMAAHPMAHDLFRPKSADEADASPFDNTGGEVVTSSPGIPDSPRVDATQLKGARHDDSVLFSLGSLQALASSSREPARAVSSTSGEGGSGLIDIRSLAGGVGPAPGAYSESRTEDILSIGGGGIGAPIGMPSLMQASEKKPNVMLYIFGGVGAFALLGVLVLLIGIFGLGWGRGVPEDDVEKTALDEEALKKKLMEELRATMGEGKTEEKGEEKVVASAAGTEENKEEESGSEESSASGTKKKKDGKKKGKESGDGGGGPDLLSSTPSKELSPGQKKTHDSLLDLIDEATEKKGKSSKAAVAKEPKEEKKEPAPAPAPAASLPSTPNKNDVLKAMKKVSPGVQKCAKGQTGTATVSIIFGGSTGKVTKAVVISGPFKGTPAATCIGGAVNKATVPKFKQSSFSVTYPFVIK
ncbi:MAG: GYF domain-containing protein, partial [Pseudomonadota bacterium]